MVELNFANTNVQAHIALRDFLRAGKIYRHFSKTSRCYQLSVCDHREVRRIAEAILPYAIVKKEKLKQLIDFIKGKTWRPTWRRHLLDDVTRKQLYDLYWNQRKSLHQIGQLFDGIGDAAVAYRLRKFGIQVRPRGHIQTLKQFNNSPLESWRLQSVGD